MTSRRPKTEQELTYSLDNSQAETIRLVQIAYDLANAIADIANEANDSPDAWERMESKTGRLERAVYRIKLDSRQHACRLDAQPS